MQRQFDDRKREDILRAVLEVFGQKGFTATTVKDIAELAGIVPGTSQEKAMALLRDGMDRIKELHPLMRGM
jgi:hypothetical protein